MKINNFCKSLCLIFISTFSFFNPIFGMVPFEKNSSIKKPLSHNDIRLILNMLNGENFLNINDAINEINRLINEESIEDVINFLNDNAPAKLFLNKTFYKNLSLQLHPDKLKSNAYNNQEPQTILNETKLKITKIKDMVKYFLSFKSIDNVLLNEMRLQKTLKNNFLFFFEDHPEKHSVARKNFKKAVAKMNSSKEKNKIKSEKYKKNIENKLIELLYWKTSGLEDIQLNKFKKLSTIFFAFLNIKNPFLNIDQDEFSQKYLYFLKILGQKILDETRFNEYFIQNDLDKKTNIEQMYSHFLNIEKEKYIAQGNGLRSYWFQLNSFKKDIKELKTDPLVVKILKKNEAEKTKLFNEINKGNYKNIKKLSRSVKRWLLENHTVKAGSIEKPEDILKIQSATTKDLLHQIDVIVKNVNYKKKISDKKNKKHNENQINAIKDEYTDILNSLSETKKVISDFQHNYENDIRGLAAIQNSLLTSEQNLAFNIEYFKNKNDPWVVFNPFSMDSGFMDGLEEIDVLPILLSTAAEEYKKSEMYGKNKFITLVNASHGLEKLKRQGTKSPQLTRAKEKCDYTIIKMNEVAMKKLRS